MSSILRLVPLLGCSTVFMTVAWYAHLAAVYFVFRGG